MSYDKRDEYPPFVECKECGETYNVDDMENEYCQDCHAIHVEEENKLFAQETLEKALTNALQNNAMPFAIGAMSNMFIRIAEENDIHKLADLINEYIKER